MKRHVLMLMLAASIHVVGQLAAQEQTLEPRTWNSRDGQYSISAILVDYDYETQMVKLKKPDDSLIQVPVLQLSDRDRRFVLRQLRKTNTDSAPAQQQDHPRNATQQDVDSLDDDAEKTTKSSRPNQRTNIQGRNVNLYGIQWQVPIQRALALGSGKETAADDRPVMWFRVLGDLSGFM